MTKEQQIVQKLIDGELSGIVTDGDYAYIPLRFTGTGITERLSEVIDDTNKPREVARIIDRRFEDFTTPELMSQYANVPIVLTHPKDDSGNCVRAGIVNGGAFVGNTIASYLKGEEIWVIGRIYDADIVDLIMGNAKNGTDLSTSPHIVSEEIEGENGILIEKPLAINSLAIVSKGFWDKKSTSPAIEGDNLTLIKEEIVADKDKADTLEQSVASDTPISDKADESVEDKVADLEKHEAKEAESFEKLAEDHKELDKGDSMEKEKENHTADKADEDKREIIREAMAVAGKNPEDFKGGNEEKVREEAKLAEELAYKNSEGDKHDESPKEEKIDEIIEDEFFTDGDKEREEVLKKIVENADEGVKIPAIGNVRYTASALIKKFAKANSELVPDKYKGMVEKIDSSTSEINNDLLNGMFENIKAKQEEAKAGATSNQGSGLFSRFSDI